MRAEAIDRFTPPQQEDLFQIAFYAICCLEGRMGRKMLLDEQRELSLHVLPRGGQPRASFILIEGGKDLIRTRHYSLYTKRGRFDLELRDELDTPEGYEKKEQERNAPTTRLQMKDFKRTMAQEIEDSERGLNDADARDAEGLKNLLKGILGLP